MKAPKQARIPSSIRNQAQSAMPESYASSAQPKPVVTWKKSLAMGQRLLSRHSLALVAFLLLALPSCGGGSAATPMLDEFDKLVTEWESKPTLTLDLDQMNELNKASIDFMAQVQEFIATGAQMTPDDLKRQSDLSTRFGKVMQKMTAK